MSGPTPNRYKDLEPQQIYKLHENEKKRQYSSRVLDIEHGTFTPLVFTTTGGMGQECLRYHSRLAELIALKKGEQYVKTISWIRANNKICPDLLERNPEQQEESPFDVKNVGFDIASAEGAIY